jgi:hypothetical protein
MVNSGEHRLSEAVGCKTAPREIAAGETVIMKLLRYYICYRSAQTLFLMQQVIGPDQILTSSGILTRCQQTKHEQ